MGSRLISDWLVRPLFDKTVINARLDAVGCFFYDPLTLAETQETMRVVRDLERIIARLNIGSANARDMNALCRSLAVLPDIKLLIGNFSSELLENLNKEINPQQEIIDLINDAICDEPPTTITEGGIIKEGYDLELDELRKAASEGKVWLAKLQKQEQERTGIKSLKVKYNKVFGYYIEVSKANLSLVPEDYLRKQTLVNAERFITPELKEMESKILGSEDKSKALEYEVFQNIRKRCLNFTCDIQQAAEAVAALDVIAGFAECARKYNYVRPHISNELALNIVNGRHPVLDASIAGERFVPNDTNLDGDRNRIMIITGPNMAGKSTYMRQTALLALMAQTGSFIPADEATIGLVDRIFTRVGAADDIARGQSTFMVEMVETANILNHCTDRSLVILDEIGRGTSTFDGLSIAWAVAEFLHDVEGSRARTLFATHYHELTELAATCRGVQNYNVAVKEYGDQVIFLRQIVRGGTDKSYGIHVAKLAGLPNAVIDRANEILENMENNTVDSCGQPLIAEHKADAKRDEPAAKRSRGRKKTAPPKNDNDSPQQMSLF